MPSDEVTSSRGEVTRLAILSAAEQLFLAQGYNGTSMRQIAEGAGNIAVGGIYNHYRSKQEIFQALLVARSPYPEVLALLDSIHEDTGPKMLRKAFIEMSSLMQRNYGFVRLVIIDIQEHDADTVRSLVTDLLPYVIQFFYRVKSTPGIRQDVTPYVLGRGFISILMGFNMTNFVLFNENAPPIPVPGLPSETEWQAGIIDMFLNGIAAGDDLAGSQG